MLEDVEIGPFGECLEEIAANCGAAIAEPARVDLLLRAPRGRFQIEEGAAGTWITLEELDQECAASSSNIDEVLDIRQVEGGRDGLRFDPSEGVDGFVIERCVRRRLFEMFEQGCAVVKFESRPPLTQRVGKTREWIPHEPRAGEHGELAEAIGAERFSRLGQREPALSIDGEDGPRDQQLENARHSRGLNPQPFCELLGAHRLFCKKVGDAELCARTEGRAHPLAGEKFEQALSRRRGAFDARRAHWTTRAPRSSTMRWARRSRTAPSLELLSPRPSVRSRSRSISLSARRRARPRSGSLAMRAEERRRLKVLSSLCSIHASSRASPTSKATRIAISLTISSARTS